MKHKILLVNGHLRVGGVERVLINLLKSLDREKYEVDLLLLQSGEDYLPQVPLYINIVRRNTEKAYGPFLPAITKALKSADIFSITFRVCIAAGYKNLKFLRSFLGLKKCYDTAIAFRPGLCEEIVLHAVSANKKFTWWHHGDFNISISRKKLIENWRKFDKVITVSNGVATQIRQMLDEPANKLCVIPNIIDLQSIKASAGEISPYCDTSKLKIVTVSRLSKEKNLPLIIKIAKCLKQQNMDFEWNIIGDGEMRTLLQEAIDQANLNSEVMLRGQKDNPYPWIKFADMMVHPSEVESFGLVLLEAMALGTICVSARSLGAIDLIDGENGILVESNAQKFVEVISRVNNHRETIGKSGLQTVESYSMENVITEFEKLTLYND